MRVSSRGRHRHFISLLYLAVPLIAPPTAHSILVNRTIDDQLGDSVTGVQPVFSPVGGWALGSQCTGCNIHPGLVDLGLAFDRTWHDTTHHPGGPVQVITATFSGSAVYVFNLIANAVPSTTTLTNLSFTLDSELVHNYVHQPDPSSPQILYSVPVYSNASLPDGPHTIEIRPTGPNSVLILFDYIAYTVEQTVFSSETVFSSDSQASPTPSIGPSMTTTPTSTFLPTTLRSNPPIGPVIGGSVAGITVFSLVTTVGVFYFWRGRKSRKLPNAWDADNRPRRAVPDLDPPSPHVPESPPVLPPFASSRHTSIQAQVEFPLRLPPLPRGTPPPTYTKHSQHHAALTERLQALETHISQSRSDPARPAETSSFGGSGGTNDAASRSTGSSGYQSLQQELVGLRNEIAEMRALMEHERQLSDELMEMGARNGAVANSGTVPFL